MDTILISFDLQFQIIDCRSRDLLSRLNPDQLFQRPDNSPTSLTPFSCGEYILRSAAAVEQTFDGITTRLWDDPFEWTLPEKLSTTDAIIGYLDEVIETRRTGFDFLVSDDDLKRTLPAPEKLKPIMQVVTEAIARSENYLGRAEAVSKLT